MTYSCKLAGGLIIVLLSAVTWLAGADDQKAAPAKSPATIVSGAGLDQPPTLTSIRDFFRLPFIQKPKVNRAGTWLISSVDTEDDHIGALFLNLKTGKKQIIRGPSDRDIDELYWLDDRHVLMSQSHEKLYADALIVTDVEELKHNYVIERNSAVEVISAPLLTPLKVIIWMVRDAYNGGHDSGAMKIDASRSIDLEINRNAMQANLVRSVEEDSGTAARVVRSYPELPSAELATGYLADGEGELAFATTMLKGVQYLYILQKSKWVRSPLDLDRYEIVSAGDVPNEVLAIGPRQEKKPRAFLRINALTGETIATVFQDSNYDPVIQGVLRQPSSHKVIGISIQRKRSETVWFDATHNEIQAQLNEAFPGKAVMIIGSDVEEKKLVVAIFSDRQPVTYSLVDLTSGAVQGIASTRPWISVGQMRQTQDLGYKTRDGLKMEGYLTLPEGASKTNPPPLVVLVHGGPWVRDLWGWDPEVQFLASRGYAVFQPNYRGSTGYGWIFAVGDDWNYKKMHEDVTDGVKQLSKSGLIDSKRIAIMGASFGGYLAMCGAAFEPDLYRCAITEAGWFDMSLRMQDAKRNQYESVRYQYFLRNLGDPETQKAVYAEISPINHIDRVKIPILIAHGKDDNIVDVLQSKQLVKQLEHFKVPHKVLLKSGEGHGLLRLDNQVEYYTAVEAFLTENMSRR